jgi:hypothetical protein
MHRVPEKELGNEMANLFSLFCVNFILLGVSAGSTGCGDRGVG